MSTEICSQMCQRNLIGLLELWLTSGRSDIKKTCLWVLSNIVCNSDLDCALVQTSPVVAVTLHLAQCSVLAIEIEAMHFITALLRRTRQLSKLLEKCEVMCLLTQLIKNQKDQTLVVLALHGLSTIFEQVGEPATIQFEKAGGLDHLERLQECKQSEIGKMA